MALRLSNQTRERWLFTPRRMVRPRLMETERIARLPKRSSTTCLAQVWKFAGFLISFVTMLLRRQIVNRDRLATARYREGKTSISFAPNEYRDPRYSPM